LLNKAIAEVGLGHAEGHDRLGDRVEALVAELDRS
jgi:hypothetical protein